MATVVMATEVEARRRQERIREAFSSLSSASRQMAALRVGDARQRDAGRDLYFLQAGENGPVKVGRSSDVPARVATLQTGCPFPIRVLAVLPGRGHRERALHSRLAYFRTSGEWFESDPAVMLALRMEAL